MSLFLCAMLYQIDQKPSSDYIDSCRDRLGFCHHRLFFELFNSGRFVHAYRTKTSRIFSVIQILTHNCNIRFLCNMVFKDFIIIKLVHRVSGCNDHIWFVTLFQEIQILIDRIGCSSVPVPVIRSDRRCKYIQTTLFSSEIPPF